jgi:hypothetical protein
MSLLEQDKRLELPDGVKKHIRGLKREGKTEEAKALREKILREKSWEYRINSHLGSEDAMRKLGDEKINAISDWILLRVSMKSGRLTQKDYRDGYNDFIAKYDGVLDDPTVVRAVSFVTQDTKPPGKYRIR